MKMTFARMNCGIQNMKRGRCCVISVQRCELWASCRLLLATCYLLLATCLLLSLAIALFTFVWARNDERGERREGGAGN